MQCISLVTVGTGAKRVSVPCGRCNYCLANKRADWSFRLNQEHLNASSAHFITLTYEDSQIPRTNTCSLPRSTASQDLGTPVLFKKDVQDFNKRLRKAQAEQSDDKLRFYTVGEYGDQTMRPHYHSIMFNLVPPIVARITDIWGKGQTLVGTVTPASIHYVTKYVINRHIDFGDRSPPFSLMSNKPGIGSIYLKTHGDYHKSANRLFANVNGIKQSLPRYYKDRLFESARLRRLAADGVAANDERVQLELERLANHHPDPYAYYNEMRAFNHDKMSEPSPLAKPSL